MVPFRTYIKRARNPKPSTGKHVNTNNQLKEELDYAHFSYTKNKHQKKSYEFRVGSLMVYYLTIIPLAHVRYEMIRAKEARIVVLLKTPPKYRKIKGMLNKPTFNADCRVKNPCRVTWRTGRLFTQNFVAATYCRFLELIQKPGILLPKFIMLR